MADERGAALHGEPMRLVDDGIGAWPMTDVHGTREPAALAQRLRARIETLENRGADICQQFAPLSGLEISCAACGYTADLHLLRDAAARLAAPVEPHATLIASLKKLAESLTCLEDRATHPTCDFCGESLGLPERSVVRDAIKALEAGAASLPATRPTPQERTLPEIIAACAAEDKRWDAMQVKPRSRWDYDDMREFSNRLVQHLDAGRGNAAKWMIDPPVAASLPQGDGLAEKLTDAVLLAADEAWREAYNAFSGDDDNEAVAAGYVAMRAVLLAAQTGEK